MLMTEYNEFTEIGRAKNLPYDDEDMFTFFFNHQNANKNAAEVIVNLAYQIYQLQVCVDGLIEDLEKLA